MLLLINLILLVDSSRVTHINTTQNMLNTSLVGIPIYSLVMNTLHYNNFSHIRKQKGSNEQRTYVLRSRILILPVTIQNLLGLT